MRDQLPPGPPPLPPEWPPPPPPLTGTPYRRPAWWVPLGVVAAVALVLAGIGIGVRLGDDDDLPAAPRAGHDEEEPAAEEQEPLGDDEVAELVDELSAYVEDQRDLAFQEDVDVEVLAPEAYRERVVESVEADLEESTEDLEHYAGLMQALGLWPPEADPVEVARTFAAAASIGFYDPETGELVVLGGADTPNLRVTLVHELTHALDDQHFDLDRGEELDERADEAGFAFSALVEGNASRVDSTYEDTLSDDERASIIDEQREALEGVDLGAIPPILLAQQQIVYTDGEAFVDAIFDDGGNEAVDDALRDPPTTSEQVLEPDRWPEREPVVAVEVPEAEGEALEDGVIGQALLGLLVDAGGASGDDPEWAGDNAVLWADGDEFCARIAIAEGEGGGSYEEALGPWAEGAGAEMEADGDLLTITSCN